MTFEDWEAAVQGGRRSDPIWRMRAYRLAGYLATESWADAVALADSKITAPIADQLYRAVGSISANLAEGYSRNSGRDRARILEYALGSARETREWYWRGEPVLGRALVRAREQVVDEILRLLLVTIRRERANDIHLGGD